MSARRLSPRLLTAIVVALFVAVALSIRVFPPFDRVFVGDWIKYTGADVYFHMRMVDIIVHNFPHLVSFDPYLIYPGGSSVSSIQFFDWLLAAVIWVIGLGSPSQHTIDIIGVYTPPVLAALTVIPVYFIGREIFGRWAGLLSAGLIAIMPGEFIGRSILGFTDLDIPNALLTTTAMLFLVLAIKSARERQLAFRHLKRRDWARITRPLIYSLLAGLCFGAFLITWRGALLFIFILAIYFIVQFIVDHWKQRSTDYLSFVGVPLFTVALVIFAPRSSDMFYVVALLIALHLPLLLNGVSRLMSAREMKPAYYPLSLLGLGLAGLAIFYIINPALLGVMLEQFSIFRVTGASLTTIEMQPILFPSGVFSMAVVWGNFTTGFYLSFISLAILIYLVVREGSADKSLLLVWSLVILAATFGQRRFAAYFAINVALLVGYLSSLALRLAGVKEVAGVFFKTSEKPDYYAILGVGRNANHKEIKKAFQKLASRYHSEDDSIQEAGESMKTVNRAYEVLSNPKKRAAYDRAEFSVMMRGKREAEQKKSGFRITTSHVNITFTVFIIFFIAFFWNINPAVTTAGLARFAPSDGWVSSLLWLKDNTPEPLGDPDSYYRRFEKSTSSGNYEYPESAYGVLAWWDYGYWITRIAHRIPNANPSQNPEPLTNVARYFTSQDEDSADEIIKELGSKYVVIDYETATSKFWAITIWAGSEQTKFFERYYVQQENQLVPVNLFYPEYYRSLVTRLYNFDGKEVSPESTLVISYREQVVPNDVLLKIITGEQQFESLEEAEAYIKDQESGNYKIVGTNPFVSPVPLKALEHYQLVHGSEQTVTLSSDTPIPAVKIFQYFGDATGEAQGN